MEGRWRWIKTYSARWCKIEINFVMELFHLITSNWNLNWVFWVFLSHSIAILLIKITTRTQYIDSVTFSVSIFSLNFPNFLLFFIHQSNFCRQMLSGLSFGFATLGQPIESCVIIYLVSTWVNIECVFVCLVVSRNLDCKNLEKKKTRQLVFFKVFSSNSFHFLRVEKWKNSLRNRWSES